MMIGAPVAACQTARQEPLTLTSAQQADADYARWYTGTIPDGEYEIPKVDRSLLDPSLAPTEVAYSSAHRPGTIVVDVDEKRLYHVQEGGMARRYGVAVGRQGYTLRGTGTIGRKAKWPSWTPTANMLRLRPTMQRHAGPGLANPLGARALYLYRGSQDTMFRIHGTNEPWSIGTSVSSGCIRMLNEDVLELYDNVQVGATVVVRRSGAAPTSA
ncbi:lipoprotein-anchoring transpeptidase ErfK/SrfK [Enterovirga rhinocerotis]|uniref:Lipoprotein-anchoring transpeptidase ErfK/SrfK n=1 Tax=Enterovirga rhinocerotis TaxID=1339210 RepID=A0A4V3DZ02_9HYPH|nr:lipoprotein-anchoring transpeptidase ErfK/SrfK [Enterovirga rhinocerotis]